MARLRSMIFAFSIGVVGATTTTGPTAALAQTPSSDAPSAPVASAPSRPAHASDGLVFAINSIHADPRGNLVIQYAIQNTTKFRKYLILYGSSVASTDNGGFGQVQPNMISGVSHCSMFFGDDPGSLKRCKTASDTLNSNGGGTNLENYTYLEPGDMLAAGIGYSIDPAHLTQAKTASFKFMALVRTATGDADALSGADAAKVVGPAQVVNVNFAFVPLKSQE